MSIPRARQLRKTMTDEEVILWSRLKLLRAEGYYFRRQAPFHAYYLDFLCKNHRLVIEVDGSHHREDDRQAEHDMVRDAIAARAGLLVLRFSNGDVRKRLVGVMDEIMSRLRERAQTYERTVGEERGASPFGVGGG